MSGKTLLAHVPTIEQKTIIFDLTGVLFHPKKWAVLYEIGLLNVLWYTLAEFKNPFSIFENKLLPLLYEIDGASHDHFYKEHYLPEINCKWQRGEIACRQLLDQVHNKINDWEKQKRFSSKTEKEIIQRIVQHIFTPDELARKSFKRIESGIAVLQAFAKQRAAGKPIKIYILSNFEKETLAVMQQLHPDVFNLFDGIAISGDLGFIKPDQQAFEKTIERFNLNAKDCLFIDDQEENVKAAQELGIQAVQFLEH